MKNWLRFSVATAASMLLIAVGVVVTYVGCDGGAVIQAPERGSAKNLLEAEAQGVGAAAESSIVYFTKDITPAGLKKVYDALIKDNNTMQPAPNAKVAVKLSTGEDGSHYLRTPLIKEFIQSLPGANIVECNVAYAAVGMTSRRGDTGKHRQLIKDHGFDSIVTTVIMDSAGSLAIPVARVSGVTRHLDSNYVGKAFANYDHYVILSHFKGHGMAGLGGAIKNISIGFASIQGKNYIHTAGTSKTSLMGGSGTQNGFQESMAEAGKSVVDYLDRKGGKILYINVMNNISVDCDCIANAVPPEMADIGILSSLDPVALDSACVGLVTKVKDETNKSLLARMKDKNGYLMISHGAKIGLGKLAYKIVDLDKTTSINSPEREIPPTGAACKLVRPE
jgi:uncharacterized protein